MRQSLESRFWSKVRKGDGCWEWLAHRNQAGYGRVSVHGRLVAAHKVAWMLAFGSFPAPGIDLDHQCHNKGCVNPAHLRPSTRKQNIENRARPQRNNSSGVHGVGWYAKYGKWRGRVQHNGRSILVGYFDSIADAEAAVIAKRNELFTNNLIDRTAHAAAA